MRTGKKFFLKSLRNISLCGMIFFFIFSAIPIHAQGFNPSALSDSEFNRLLDITASTQGIDYSAAEEELLYKYAIGAVSTSDKATLEKMKMEARYVRLKDKAKVLKDKAWDALKRAAAVSIHTGLKTLASRYAHDIAVKVATGLAGQKPAFETRTPLQLLEDTANSTLGLFIENLGKGLWGEQFSLCEFDVNIRLKIGLGLYRDFYTPPQPECGWEEMLANFKDLKDQDVNQYFQASISPYSSEAGAVLVLGTNLLEESERKQQSSIGDYIAKQGWLDFRDPSDQVKTPAETYKQSQGTGLDAIANWGKEMTGDIVTDALTVFTNTLLGTWIEKMLTKGQVDIPRVEQVVTSPEESAGGTLASVDAEAISGGVQGAEAYYKDLLNVEYTEGGTFDVLLALASTCNESELWKCPVNSNTITEKFRSAIEQELSVQEAIDKNLLDPNLPFGFGDKGVLLTRETGYPHRALLLLRKYRIVPVGWEIAANYVRVNGTSANLGKIIGDFSNIDSPFYGLIDPTWVLKAPKNYCVKQGPGPTVVAVSDISAVDADGDGTNDTHASFAVTRDAEYCADERGCIKEANDGTCLQYGFCLEERPVWKFDGAESCESQYNTCETFTARDKQVASFLQNSLDYENCYEGNVGCGWYCKDYSFKDGLWLCEDQDHTYNVCDQAGGCYITEGSLSCTISYGAISCVANSGDTLYYGEARSSSDATVYLDSSANSCTETQAGCSQFIPLSENSVNFLPNSSFEYIFDSEGKIISASSLDPIPSDGNFAGVKLISGDAPAISTSPRSGAVSLLLTSNSRVQIPVDIASSIANRTFSFALHARDYFTETEPSRSCAGVTLRVNNASSNTLDAIPDTWTRYGVVHSFGPYTSGNTVLLEIDASSLDSANVGCLIDDLSLEESAEPSSYVSYGNVSTYLIVAPDNFGCDGYTAVDETLADQASCEGARKVWRDDIGLCVQSGSSACVGYALYCQATDVGCALYTAKKDNLQVPAVVGAADYCPEECNGYDTFKQEATYLEDAEFPIYFIPSTAESCQATDAGCDEFTNLDTVAKGGEGREYYSYVRQCKADNEGCGNFYSWVGSEDTGYQIRNYSLLKKDDGSIAEVPTFLQVQGECKSINDAILNPECKQFFDALGNEHFAFLKNTLSCADTCSPYRKTTIGALPVPEGTADAKTYCEDNGGDWSGDTNTCYLCSKFSGNMYADGKDSTKDTGNDGVQGNEACIFFIVPGEGIECNAEAAGCREYTGDTGESTLTVYQNDFENGIDDWTGGILSGESPYVGGHSLKILPANIAETSLENTSLAPSLYTVSFWAKHGANSSTEKIFLDFSLNSKDIATVAINEEWNVYTIGPIEFPAEITDVAFSLKGVKEDGSAGNANIYVDNLSLRQLSDTLYRKKNSWTTPQICDQDPFGVSSPQYMLGCQEYADKDGGKLYLKSFESLCRDELVGCEAFIDTQNTTMPFESQYGPESSRINISADKPVFLVDNGEYSCSSNAKGCQALGKPTYNEKYELSSLETTYLINDPEQYSTILCSEEELWCDAWSAGDEVSYFKNPLTDVCEYKEVDSAYGSGWYKVSTNSGAPDCPTMLSEVGNVIPTWAGLCPSTQASCTEYIDAVSTIERNLLTNGNFEQDEDKNNKPDAWEGTSTYEKDGIASSYAVLTSALQTSEQVTLLSETVYTIAGNIKKEDVLSTTSLPTDYGYLKVVFDSPPSGLNSYDNSMTVLNENTIELRISLEKITDNYFRFSGRFYSGDATQANIIIGVSNSNEIWFDDISLVKTGVYYNLKDGVDYTSCQNADPKNNCVLFNDRSDFNWASYKPTLENYFEDPVNNAFDASSLTFDADQNSTDCSNPNQSTTLCDSNRIIKTRKDRICEDWLYCKSSTTVYNSNTAKQNDICLDLGRCNEMDETGRCISAPFENDPVNLTFNKGNIANLSYLTGYSKAGFDWGNGNVVEGYYPSSQMEQLGSLAVVPNGSFESADASGKPVAWYADDSALFDQGSYGVLTSLSQMQNALLSTNIVLPPDGRAFFGMKPSSDILVHSPMISVFPNTEYVLSAAVDTSKMFGGEAAIQVAEFDANGAQYLAPEKNSLIQQKSSIPWQRASHLWKTGSKTSQIQIYLVTTNTAKTGDVQLSDLVFFDDIELSSALLTRESKKSYESSYDSLVYAGKDCRLYPDESASTCEYFSEDGTLKHGWYGYCLEYDPTNPNACLTWWPVDQVSGDSADSNTSLAYRSRIPLYMCMEMQQYTNDYIAETIIDFNSTSDCVPAGQYSWTDGYAKGLYKNEIQSIIILAQEGASFSSKTLNEKGSWTNIAEQKVYKDKSSETFYDVFSTNCSDGTTDYDEIATCNCNENLEDEAQWGHCSNDSPENSNEGHWCFPDTMDTGGVDWGCKDEESGEDFCNIVEDQNYGIGFKAIFTGGVNPRFSHIEVVAQGHGTTATGSIPFRAQVQFVLSDRFCSTVAEVVSPYGENQSWASRLDSVNKYEVPELKYTYSTDYRPFGGLVPPNPVEIPEDWDAVPGTSVCSNDVSIACKTNDECGYNGVCTDLYQGRQPIRWQLPDVNQFSTPPYQVRFSSPYAYVGGDANIPFFMCSETEQLCVYNTDCPNYATGEKCQSSTGTPFVFSDEKQDTYQDAVELVKRVFAKSYGVWEFELGVCESGKIGESCYIDKDCSTDANIPETKTIELSQNAQLYTRPSTGGEPSDPEIIAQCGAGEVNFKADGTALISKDQIMKIMISGVDGLELNTGNNWEANYSSDGTTCKDLDGLMESFNKGDCSCAGGNTEIFYVAKANFDADKLESVSFYVESDAEPFEIGNYEVLVYLKESAGICESPAGYILSDTKNGWNTPSTECPSTVRPAYASGGTADYCFIKPKVSNGKFSPDEISNQGYATLSFNSTIDKEQLPLSGMRIDWGDGEVSSLGGLNVVHRPNADDPHKFTHFYSYGDLLQKFSGNNPHFPPTSLQIIQCNDFFCEINATIQIMDHWNVPSATTIVPVQVLKE